MPDRDPIVTPEWLEAHLDDPSVRVVDVRGYVVARPVAPGVEEADYKGAPEEYAASHIPGAVYVDWTRDIVDLDDPVKAQVAKPGAFAEAMAARGIGDETHVVAVDHMGGQYATRLWWALAYHGHDRVSVLQGGWNRWVEEGRPTGRAGPATRRRPRRRPVHGGASPRPAGRAHPGGRQHPPRAVLRRGGRVPAARRTPGGRRTREPGPESARRRLLQRRRRGHGRPVQPRPPWPRRPRQL